MKVADSKRITFGDRCIDFLVKTPLRCRLRKSSHKGSTDDQLHQLQLRDIHSRYP